MTGTQANPSSRNASIADALSNAHRILATDPMSAAEMARGILRVERRNIYALRLLARALRTLGQAGAAETAELDAISASVGDPRLMEAAVGLLNNDLPHAERLLRAHLTNDPFDVAAIRMMAELAGRLGRYRDAESLLRRALELAPAFGPARANLATVLHRQNRPGEALAELDTLLQADPANPSHANLKAATLGRIGEYEEAIELYETVLRQLPDQPKIWMSYGHVLKTVGRQEDCIAAYRRAIGIRPELGEVWWSLANLKTFRFSEADIATIEAALAADGLGIDDRFHLDFALGKALEDRGDAARAFGHYAVANALRRTQLDYDPGEIGRASCRERVFVGV